MMKQKWDKYEIALLIEVYWKIREIKNNDVDMTEDDLISELSCMLKERVRDCSDVFDESYRNEDEIKKQLKLLGYIFSYGHYGAMPGSELMLEMVDTYRYNRAGYNKVLKMAKQSTTVMKKDIGNMNSTLAEKYNIDMNAYGSTSVETVGFSLRVLNILRNNGILTIGALLGCSEKALMKFRGFGANCLNEIYSCCGELKPEGPSNTERAPTRVAPKVWGYFKSKLGAVNDGSPVDQTSLAEDSFSDEEFKQLTTLFEGYDLLGKELVHDCLYAPEKVISIANMFNEYIDATKYSSTIRMLVEDLPKARRNNVVKPYIFAFTIDEEEQRKLIELCKSDSATFASLINCDAMNYDEYSLVCRFIKWCSFDIRQDINEMFSSLFCNEKEEKILSMRAAGCTLEQIGNEISLTRERVRQIEGKIKKRFFRQQTKIGIISKIYAERNGDTVLTRLEISEYCSAHCSELIYLLQTCESLNYVYDKQYDVFIVGNDSLAEKTQSVIEELPDVIRVEKIDEIIKNVVEENGISEELFVKALQDAYKRTGDVLHKTRLSLRVIYENVLEEYYPDGIKVYDAEELKMFRERIKERYGDIKLPENDRALTVRLSSICILRDRGVYCLKKDKYISQDLLERILDYVNNSENVVFLTNSIFAVFEEELRSQGVDNKYYLQGILHELFPDDLTFKRDYISKDANVTSVYTSIVDYIRRSDYPVRKQQIQEAFPGVTDIVINFAVSDSEVLNYFGEYLHASHIALEYDEKKKLEELLQTVVSDDAPHHIKDIFEILRVTYFNTLTRNAAMQPFKAYSLLEYLFRDKFQFSRPYIAKNGTKIERPGEVLHEMIYCQDSFYVSEISEFARLNHFQIQSLLNYIEGCFDEFLLVDDTTLVRIEKTGVDSSMVTKIEEVILNELTDTRPIEELTIWNELPKLNYRWSEWLLYSVLKKWGSRLVVSTSVNQFKYAIPLVAPIGHYDPDAYKGTYRNKSTAIVVDDLDDIDALLEDILDDDLLEEIT